MPETLLRDRLQQVHGQILRSQKAGGWEHPVRIVAVTKTHGPEAVRQAAQAGLLDVGENRIQEALPKQDACWDVAVKWHLIGSLQRNKVRQIVGRFSLIHSVDRLDLAQEIDHRVGSGYRQDVLVQVNCSDEVQKSGVDAGALPQLLDAMRHLSRLNVGGLMTMAALTDDESEQHRAFAKLRSLRDEMQKEGHHLPELSMGMSGDYAAAVEEGATILRLGTLLFGVRE